MLRAETRGLFDGLFGARPQARRSRGTISRIRKKAQDKGAPTDSGHSPPIACTVPLIAAYIQYRQAIRYVAVARGASVDRGKGEL